MNLIKGGIVYSNFVTTVSPGHAWEVCYSDQGHGLGHTLHVHRDKFGGVLNGVDYETWNPEIDPWIARRYGPDSIDDKYVNKHALRERFMLRDEYKPIVCYVGRLDRQKGVHLVHHAIFYALEQGAQFVLLGSSPDPAISGHFWHLKHHLNDHPDVHLELQLRPRARAPGVRGVRPAGDAQHVRALRPGAADRAASTAPSRSSARQAGSPTPSPTATTLAILPSSAPATSFEHADHQAIESAMARAIGLWHGDPQDFRDLALNGMRIDRSWARPAQDYLNIYDHIRHK